MQCIDPGNASHVPFPIFTILCHVISRGSLSSLTLHPQHTARDHKISVFFSEALCVLLSPLVLFLLSQLWLFSSLL